jgi:hypothetical protein
VPLYDGTGRDFCPNDVPKLEFDQWKGSEEDVPAGTLMLVGYTTSKYLQEGNACLGFNVQWGIVLAVPDEI